MWYDMSHRTYLTHAPVQDIIRKSKTARRLEEASSVISFAVTGSLVF
jgi:hypothetical protein